MLERRREPRWLTFKTGMIHSAGLPADFECAILDLSQGGACLLVPGGARIPDTFDLTIDPQGDSHTCQVRWKAESRIGVSFRARVLSFLELSA